MARDRIFLDVLPAMRLAYLPSAGRSLDFGGGIGSDAIAMANFGLDTTFG